MQGGTGRTGEDVSRLLCRGFFRSYCRQKYRFEAGGEHQQVFDSFGETWR